MTYFVVVTNKTEYYVDLADSPSTTTNYVPMSIYNNTNLDLYFKVKLKSVNGGNPDDAGYSNYERTIGLISPGNKNLKSYLQFDKDISTITSYPTTDSLTITVEAYSDDTYTTLVDSQDITVNYTYVNHKDSSAVILEKWDFDDGTTQGWSGFDGVDSGTYFSSPYSAKFNETYTKRYLTSPTVSFTTTTGERYWLSFKFRLSSASADINKVEYSTDGGSTYNLLDSFDKTSGSLDELVNKWICYCAKLPLPEGVTVDLKIRINAKNDNTAHWYDDIVIFKQ